MKYILDAKSMTRTKTGLLICVVHRVRWIAGPGLMQTDVLCRLLYPRFGGYRKPISSTATLASPMFPDTHKKQTLHQIPKSAISFETSDTK
jgi:hypothetical protein